MSLVIWLICIIIQFDFYNLLIILYPRFLLILSLRSSVLASLIPFEN